MSVKTLTDEQLKEVINLCQAKINKAKEDYERIQLSFRLEQQGYINEYNERLFNKNNQ